MAVEGSEVAGQAPISSEAKGSTESTTVGVRHMECYYVEFNDRGGGETLRNFASR